MTSTETASTTYTCQLCGEIVSVLDQPAHMDGHEPVIPAPLTVTFARLVELEELYAAARLTAMAGRFEWDRFRGREWMARIRTERDQLWTQLSLDDLRAFGEYRKSGG